MRQLEERAWVARRLGDDAIANPQIERAGSDRREERVRLRVRETLDDQFGYSGKVVGVFAQREYQRDALGTQSARHEREQLLRSPVEQVRVVDDTKQRLVRGHLGQKSQHGEPDEERIRRA